MNITKQKQTHRSENKLVVTSGERVEGGEDRSRRLRGTNHYVGNKWATRMYGIAQGIWLIFYNNFK